MAAIILDGFNVKKTKKILIWMVINLSIRLSLPKSPIKISFEHLTEVEQRMALYVATLYTASAIRLSQKHDWIYAQWNTRSLYLLKTMGGASIFRYINKMMLITYKVEWSTIVIFLKCLDAIILLLQTSNYEWSNI